MERTTTVTLYHVTDRDVDCLMAALDDYIERVTEMEADTDSHKWTAEQAKSELELLRSMTDRARGLKDRIIDGMTLNE